MTEEQELKLARILLDKARTNAVFYCKEDQDHDAATVAILMKAFELATQDLSTERRNQLLKGEWE